MKLIILGAIFICAVCQTEAQRAAPETPKNCDFSSYKPIRMKHFPDGAVIKEVSPKYPKKARTRKVEGKVSVKVLINEEGVVEKACAFDGQKIFGTEAEKAALQWKFRPLVLQDKAQKKYLFAFIGFDFKLPR